MSGFRELATSADAAAAAEAFAAERSGPEVATGEITTCDRTPVRDESPGLPGLSPDAPGRNRTYDLWLRRPALYPLSYERANVQSSGVRLVRSGPGP
jgi:hypothetical protein